MFHMWDWGFGIGGIMMFFIWLFVAAIAVIVIVVVINSTKQSQGSHNSIKTTHDSAVERVRERYANGEINREEYQQMLEDLKDK